MDVNALLQSIGSALVPNSYGDIFAYSIFFLSLLVLIFLPDGNERSTYLLFGTMFLAVIDLFRTGIALPIDPALLSDAGFVTYFIHILMFIFPALASGLIRIRKKQGGLARIIGFVTVLIAVMYTVMSFLQPGLIYATRSFF